MKSLKTHSLNLTEKAYHEYPAWSYSMISKYAKGGFYSVAKIHQPVAPTPEMEFGSLLDSILTRGKETFKEYSVSNYEVMPAEKKVLDYALSAFPGVPFTSITKEDWESVFTNTAYYSNRSYEKKYEQVAACQEYYNVRYQGKKVVSKQDWEDATTMAKTLVTDKYTSTIFGTKNTKDIEYIYQAQFLVDWTLPSGKTAKIKIMPDLLVVNHTEKTIRPVDLKSTSLPGGNFKDNFIGLRYDIQASEYTAVLQSVIDNDEDYKEYTILPYFFAVISRMDMVPIVYEYDPRSESQIDGLSFGKFHYKNWEQLLDEIITYEETQAKVPSYITTDGPNDLLAILEQ